MDYSCKKIFFFTGIGLKYINLIKFQSRKTYKWNNILDWYSLIVVNRSYYKCTNPRCSAKKQVERSNDDPDTLIITYEGLHLHYVYPYLLLNQPQGQANDPPPKKQKRSIDQSQVHLAQDQAQAQGSPKDSDDEAQLRASDSDGVIEDGVVVGSQGLLEDMVPLVIRNPSCKNNISSDFAVPSCSSYRSSTYSPSSPTWSPFDTSCLDMGIE